VLKGEAFALVAIATVDFAITIDVAGAIAVAQSCGVGVGGLLAEDG